MEGRVSRDELMRTRPDTAETVRADTYTPSRDYAADSYRSASASGRSGRGGRSGRSYSYKKKYKKPQTIPEGRDLLIVQMLASGVLLLFVMLIAIVRSDITEKTAARLDAAFSKNTSFSELKDGLYVARDKLKGGADAVLEIFGAEIDISGDASETAAADLTDSANSTEKMNSTGASGAAGADGVSDATAPYDADTGVLIDAETLEQLYDAADDYPNDSGDLVNPKN